jgi:hypothetical protein
MDENHSATSENPHSKESVRAPYVSISLSRKLIGTMGWCIVGLVVVTLILGIALSVSLQKKPWVLVNNGKGFEEIGIGEWKANRGEVERFLNLAVPNLYGSLNGDGPGLNELRGLVNENILLQQEGELSANKEDYQEQGVSQFAIVTGINPDTLVINHSKNFVYAEVLGTIVLTKGRRSEQTNVQWRVLLYIVEPTDALMSETPGGRMKGNRMGLYLQQIAEQAPGTINEDSPKPTMEDIKAREAEKAAQQ